MERRAAERRLGVTLLSRSEDLWPPTHESKKRFMNGARSVPAQTETL